MLAPVLEYLMDTEIGETGFSAHELQTGYSLLQEPDATFEILRRRQPPPRRQRRQAPLRRNPASHGPLPAAAEKLTALAPQLQGRTAPTDLNCHELAGLCEREMRERQQGSER